MKGNRFTIGLLFALVLMIVFVLAACAQSEPIATPDMSDGCDTYAIPSIYDSNDAYLEAETDTSDNVFAITISEENQIALRESLFIGEGDTPPASGDALHWYLFAFSWDINGIPTHFMDIIGHQAWEGWRNQFTGRGAHGQRNIREANLITFIEDNNISKEDIIRAQELVYSRPRYEIEALINWGRYGTSSPVTDPGNEAFWAMQFSLSDLDILFSGDVSRIWERYPGHGVLHNGRVYTPEWILNNMEMAIGVEQIPLGEIERVLDQASDFSYFLGNVVASAEAVLQAAR